MAKHQTNLRMFRHITSMLGGHLHYNADSRNYFIICIDDILPENDVNQLLSETGRRHFYAALPGADYAVEHPDNIRFTKFKDLFLDSAILRFYGIGYDAGRTKTAKDIRQG
ncbi:MAG: hypothetical protein GXP63_01235 [DPANN group archaeon]|nr:hypothetical protein [DPANN group archaeon]